MRILPEGGEACRPVNCKRIIAKSEDFSEDEATFSRIVQIEKMNEEKRVVYRIVYAPGKEVRRGQK